MKPVVEPLSELLGTIEQNYEEHWGKADRSADREAKQRAFTLLAALLPPTLNVPRATLVNRVRDGKLIDVVDGWTWSDGNIVLLGPSQLGKTTAAAYLVRKLVFRAAASAASVWERAERMAFFPALELAAAVREYPLGQGEPEAVRRARAASLLVLDDVKVGMDADVLMRVLDFRRAQDRQTLVTSGHTVEELAQAFGESVWHRMAQCGGRTSKVVACFRRPT